MPPQPPARPERDASESATPPQIGLSSCVPLLDALPDAMILIDAEGRIAHANRHALRLFLTDLEVLRGEPVEALLPERLRHRQVSLRDALEPADFRAGDGTELMAARGDGSEFYAEVMLSRMRLHEGTYVLADVRDVTDRKHAEVQLQRHADEMEEFAEAVTHDLKAPLLGIQWLTNEAIEQIERDRDCPIAFDTRMLLSKIQRSAAQMRELIDGLLEVTRFGTDGGDASLARAHEVAASVQATFAPGAEQRDVSIEIHQIEIDTLPVAAAHLRQILHNLVGNAMKFVPRRVGHIRIRTEEHFGPRGERLAWLIVDDNGPGITADDRERIFRVFQRGNDRADAEPGIGLGLSLVRRVATLYGGRAWVDDSPLGGARFVVELPVSVPVTGARAALDLIHESVHDRQRQQAGAAL